MIDIHCHVLPGVDDGAPDEATALAMCRLAAESGTTDLVATPHANTQFAFSPEVNEQKRARLQAALGESLRLYAGCDFHLTYDNMEAALANRARFTINGGPYLLVEFSEQVIARSTSEIFSRLRGAGLTPIITHPERNVQLQQHRSRLAAWVGRGCLIQVTGQSLLGRFGEQARKSAIALINAGLVHVIASDGHDLKNRPPVLSDSFQFVSYRWGERAARRLFVEHPRAVLDGAVIAVSDPGARRRKKKWWAFWR